MITISLIHSADSIISIHAKSYRYTSENWIIADCAEAGEYRINLNNVAFIRTVPDAES